MPNVTGREIETSFIESSYKSNFNYEALFATAKRIQTLILMEPGTIPNYTLAGVGIRKYLFNFKDDITLSQINTKIVNQVSKYLPNSNVQGITVTPYPSPSGNMKGIIVTIQIYDASNSSVVNTIMLSFTTTVKSSQTIKSDIYL
jgi:hypothetical protein